MANEITLSGSLSYKRDTTSVKMSGSGNADAGDHFIQNLADIGTTEETLPKGDVGTIGYVAFRNKDASNYVEIGASAGVYAFKLGPGKYAGPMAWTGENIYAKANGAPVKLEYLIVEAASA